MVLNKKIRRLGIFIFFDIESVIDDYVLFMLDSLKEAVDDLIVVSNSYLPNEELEKFLKYTDKIEVRDNYGLDAAAFKYIYDKYGQEYFSQYDEVILCNDTFYGPFEPYKSIVKKMEKRDIDFWGLTANYDSEDGYGTMEYGYIPAHIQTFFIAFRNSVLTSSAFDNYWTNYDVKHMLSFSDVVMKHELTFTNYLEKNGFCWDTYLDLKYFKSDIKEQNYNIYGYSTNNLVRNFNCPFIKRKNLVFDKNDALYLNNGIDARNCLNYINENGIYDVDMILKNLIRIYDPIDIYQGLNLNYIVSKTKETISRSLIYISVSDIKTLQLLKTYISNIKLHDVIIVTDSKEVNDYDKSIKLVNPVNYVFIHREKWIKKYNYICLLNLKRNFDDRIIEIDDSNILKILQNAIENDSYINGVLNIFDQHKYLGALYLPASFHNKFFSNISGYAWKKNIKVIRENNCGINIREDKFIPHSNQGLWIHSYVLNNLENKDFTLNELISILPFTLKKNNQCIGKVYHDDYIINDMTCMEKIISKVFVQNTEEIEYPIITSEVVGNESILRKLIRRFIPRTIRSKIKNILKHK